MTTMLNKAAEALVAAQIEFTRKYLDDGERTDLARNSVLAVLHAIREPSAPCLHNGEGMTDFILPKEIGCNTHRARLDEMRTAWQVMIDHIIAEQEA